MKRILVLALTLASGLLGFYWKPSPSGDKSQLAHVSITPALSESPVSVTSTVATIEIPSPKSNSPEINKPLPASHSDTPRALPDQDIAKQSRAFVTAEWARTRERILRDEFQVSLETISNLDQRNQSYLKEVAQLIKPATPQEDPTHAMLASPEQMNQISERYQKDVTQLLGEDAFHRLVAERSRLVEQYRFDGYSIPLSIY